MLFTADIVELKGYFEVFFEESPPFKLSLTDTDSSHTVWSAVIREGTINIHLTYCLQADTEDLIRHTVLYFILTVMKPL